MSTFSGMASYSKSDWCRDLGLSCASHSLILCTSHTHTCVAVVCGALCLSNFTLAHTHLVLCSWFVVGFVSSIKPNFLHSKIFWSIRNSVQRSTFDWKFKIFENVSIHIWSSTLDVQRWSGWPQKPGKRVQTTYLPRALMRERNI